MSPTVCADLIKCASLFDGAIKCNYVVVADFLHTLLAVPLVNVARVEVLARACGRAVDDDVVEASHGQTCLGSWFHSLRVLTRLVTFLPW